MTFVPGWLPPDATTCPACGSQSVIPVVVGRTSTTGPAGRGYSKTITEHVCRARASAAILSTPCGWRARYARPGDAA